MRRLSLIVCWVCVRASAQESLDDLDKGKGDAKTATAKPAELAMGSTEGKAVAEVNGYLDNRFQYGWIHTGGLVPTRDAPSVTDLLEGNIQLKIAIGQRAFVYADLSLF